LTTKEAHVEIKESLELDKFAKKLTLEEPAELQEKEQFNTNVKKASFEELKLNL